MRFLSATTLIFLISGCATSGQTDLLDFNTEFKQNIPTDPKYKIESAGLNRYQVVVYQGSALLSERTTRAAYLTRAGLIAMEAHCLKRSGVLGTHTFRDNVDSMGYINVLGFFNCKSIAQPKESDSKKEKSIEI
jgi:hypothetical protein